MGALQQLGTSKTAPAPRGTAIFAGLGLTEFCERFALAGAKSMLTLLLIDVVLAPASGAAGVGWLQRMLGQESGRQALGLASLIYGVANALLYLSIPLGGLLGDLLIGRRASVLTGGFSMIAGLGLMISLQAFLPGLLLFAVGAGLLKGNLSVQFGALFADEGRRRRGYSYYLVFLNAGVICGPLAMGLVALTSGWRYALGLAIGIVAAGLLVYTRLSRHFPADEPRVAGAAPAAAATMGEPRRALRFLAALIGVYLCFAAYGQIGNILLVWTEQRVALDVAGWTMPVGWILALDGAFTIFLVFASQAVFRALRRRGIAIGPLTQIVLGCLFCAGGYLVLAAAEWAGGETLSPGWIVAYLLLVDLGIVLVWPSGLSLATELAPSGRAGMWTGLFYLHGFFASLWVGFAGGLFEVTGAATFWLLHAGVALGGGALSMLAALLATRPPVQAITSSA